LVSPHVLSLDRGRRPTTLRPGFRFRGALRVRARAVRPGPRDRPRRMAPRGPVAGRSVHEDLQLPAQGDELPARAAGGPAV